MKKRLWQVGCLLLAGAGAGCGDTPRACFRGAYQLQNELADTMAAVDNEDSAAGAKPTIERLKAGWESIQKRMEHFTNPNVKDTAGSMALLAGATSTAREGTETALRLGTEVERLKIIKTQLGGATPNLDALIAAPTTLWAGNIWHDNPVFLGMTGPTAGPMGGGPAPVFPPGVMPGGPPGMPPGAPPGGPPVMPPK